MPTDRLTTVKSLSPLAHKILQIMASVDQRPLTQPELTGELGGGGWNTIKAALLSLKLSKFVASGHKKWVITQCGLEFVFSSPREENFSPKGLPLKDKGKPNMGISENSSSSAPLLTFLEGESFPSLREGKNGKSPEMSSLTEGNSDDPSEMSSPTEGKFKVSLGEYDPDLRIKQKTYICKMLGMYGEHITKLASDETVSPSEIFAQYYIWTENNIKRRKDKIIPLRLGVVTKSCIEHRRSNAKAKEYARWRMTRDVEFICIQCGQSTLLPVTICQDPISIVQKCPDCQTAVVMVDADGNGMMPEPSEETNNLQHDEAVRHADYYDYPD